MEYAALHLNMCNALPDGLDKRLKGSDVPLKRGAGASSRLRCCTSWLAQVWLQSIMSVEKGCTRGNRINLDVCD